MKKWVLYLCVSCGIYLMVFSCKYSNEYQSINAGNDFTIEVPSWMNKEENLAVGAPFQYANRYRNFYTVGFVSKKDTLSLPLNVYWNTSLMALKESLTTPFVTDSLNINVNGMKGVRVEILGKMDEENIYFSEIMLEGKTNIFHLSVWVRGEERKLRFKEDINRIITSVKEL